MMRRLVALAVAAVALFFAALLLFVAATVPGSSGPDLGIESPPTYGLPSPSYWPLSPYPAGSVQPLPPPPTVSPCPSWAPTLVHHSDGTYECKATLPPDPGGPRLAPCEPELASPYPCPTPSVAKP